MNFVQKRAVGRIGILLLSLVVMVGLLFAWMPGMPAGVGEFPIVHGESEDSATLSLSGPSSVAPGSTFVMLVQVSDVKELYGAAVELTFDPDELQVVDADSDTPGVQVTPGADWQGNDTMIVENEADNETGTLHFAVSKLGQVPGVTVSGEDQLTLTELSFKVQERVTGGDVLTVTPVDDDVQLANSQNEPIEVSAERLHIEVFVDDGGSSGGGSKDDGDDDDDDDRRAPRDEESAPFADLQGVEPEIVADIRALSEAGIITGYVRNGVLMFEPWQPAKRAQVAKVIAGALELQPDAAAAEQFPDVVAQVKDATDRGWIGALDKAGIANGYTDGNFGPYDDVTRQQLASFFIRALGLEDTADMLYKAGIIRLDFQDALLVDPAHAANVALADEIGFLQGRAGGSIFDPRVRAFRSHLAKFGNQLYSEAKVYQEAAEALLATMESTASSK